MLIIGQPAVERTLLFQLRASRQPNVPLALWFNHRARTIVEDAEGVRVVSEGQTAYGVPSKVMTWAKFAIGADGARSMVRSSLGFGFEGSQPEMTWVVLDTFIDTDFPVCPEIISLQHDGQCRVLWVPRGCRLSRFYIRLLEGQAATESAAQATIREHMAPYRVTFLGTEWFSTFEGKISAAKKQQYAVAFSTRSTGANCRP